jgi:hypothetical protein
MKDSKSKISEIDGFNNFIFQMQQKDKILLQNNSQIGKQEMLNNFN